jgi:hypothetical protein
MPTWASCCGLIGAIWAVSLYPVITQAEEEYTDPINMSLIFAGPSEISEVDDDVKFDGYHIGLTTINFLRAIDARMVLAYHYGNLKLDGTEHEIQMPEIALNLDANLFALPMLCRILQKPSFAINAGGGFGITYLPYRYAHTTGSGTSIVKTSRWYWDHSAWNVHALGGVALDRRLGVMAGLYVTTPITSKPKFSVTDLRFGLIYRL